MTNAVEARWGKASAFHDPEILAHFKPRPSDVLITTAPKAGTTWMQQILHQLRSGGDPDFFSIDAVVPWLEKPRRDKTWQQRLADYEQIEDPRVFKTHCTFSQTPGFGEVKIVMTSRDPRDCCVSFYHHIMDMTDEALALSGRQRPASFDAYFEEWMDFASWYRNVESWWPYKGHESVLWLRYEDMKRDFAAALRQILAFLGWQLDDGQFQRAMEYSSFAWMKQHSDKFARQLGSERPIFKPGGFIRKGVVGDHQGKLSPVQAQRIMDKAASTLPDDCLKFVMNY